MHLALLDDPPKFMEEEDAQRAMHGATGRDGVPMWEEYYFDGEDMTEAMMNA